jgi:excinuclease ABC subunit C
MIPPERVHELPHEPGVYLMRDAAGELLYVGKAKDLRKRVSSYFKAGHTGKTAALVARVEGIEVLVTDNEVEALILESNLVKQHQPRFNILLRDDKHYPYIRISTDEPFPRLEVVRRIERDGAAYFGPYPSSTAMRRVIELINRHFLLRKRRTTIDERPKRPCLNYQIGRCLAPCAHKVDQATYRGVVDEALQFLRGEYGPLLASLREKMAAASSALDFELAAQLRDQIEAVELVFEQQKIIDPRLQDRDVLAAVQDGAMVEAVLLSVRRGHLLGQRHLSVDDADPEAGGEALEAFVKQHYAHAAQVPPELLVDRELSDRSSLEAWLGRLAGRRVQIRAAQRGAGVRLVRMAAKNASLALQARRSRIGVPEVLARLAEALGLAAPPRRIECVDNSNIQGTDPVASLVVCVDGVMKKSAYRRFKIRTVEGADDYATMNEVVGRRLDRLVAEGRELPDLLLLDGGRGQLSAAMEALCARGLEERLELAAIAKGRPEAAEPRDRSDRIFRPGSAEPAALRPGEPAMLLLQRVRDEAHRFAVAFHAQRHHKRSLGSALDEVPGVGAVRKRELLRAFGSLARIAEASVDELAAVRGLDRRAAQRIREHFRSCPPPEASTGRSRRQP